MIIDFIKRSWRGEENFWKVLLIWGVAGNFPLITPWLYIKLTGEFLVEPYDPINWNMLVIYGVYSLISFIIIWRSVPPKQYLKLCVAILSGIVLWMPAILGLVFILGSIYVVFTKTSQFLSTLL